MLINLVCPFFYSVLSGSVWSACFKKKFSSSLAPAYMFHILIVLICGLVFNRLSIGIYGGVIGFAIIGLFLLLKNRKSITTHKAYEYIVYTLNNGLLLFCIFYLFCFFINYGKKFLSWDEFSHWGMFLKECLRLDSLYCTSPLTFDHKDYVPAITLFESIWCKLSGKYSEPNAYRAIQIFMFSMLMPILECFNDNSLTQTENKTHIHYMHKIYRYGAATLVLSIPLLFNTSNAFLFYHSIYCDMVVGVLFFWCVFELFRNTSILPYQILILAIGTSTLVLAKMTSMALIPLILLFAILLFLTGNKFNDKQSYITLFGLIVFTTAIPVLLWIWFDRFVDKYVANVGNRQSYDGMSISSVSQVFFNPSNSGIPYIEEVKYNYSQALLHNDILLNGSYIVTILFITIGFIAISYYVVDANLKKRILATGIWTLISSIYYAMLMYFLYCTAFDEYEAVQYKKYINIA